MLRADHAFGNPQGVSTYSGVTFGHARDKFGAREMLAAGKLCQEWGPDAWRIELNHAIPSEAKMKEVGCNPARIARMLQNSQHERPEDVGYAVRALEVARGDCAVALQSMKVFAWSRSNIQVSGSHSRDS